jgi:hypothetical protein
MKKMNMESYFQDIEHHIIKHIKIAKSRLLIAVAWFTNEKIGLEIIKKKSLDIEVILDDNQKNRECRNILTLQSQNIDVNFVKDLTKNYYIMHNKFCVIDNKFVITGSYNWTINSNTNDENISVFNDSITAALYTQEFRRIKEIKFPSGNISITNEEATEITELMYPFLLQLLKDNISNLEKGLLVNWTDTKIKNKIRAINERLRITLHNRVGPFGVYYELISKYGFEFNSRATEEEKVKARDDFNKNGLDEVDYHVHKTFQFLKIKSLNKLRDKYAILLNEKRNEMNEMKKIFKVFEFITRERIEIAKEINISSI